MKKFWIIRALKIAVFVVLAVLAAGFVVMSLWNWLVPSLFHGPVIDFCQALGILVLSKILFGGFKKGGHCCGGHCHRGGMGNWKDRWKNKWEEKLSKMSPEEREKIKQKLKSKCGPWMEDPFTEKDETKKE
jgi:hypothetical protein